MSSIKVLFNLKGQKSVASCFGRRLGKYLPSKNVNVFAIIFGVQFPFSIKHAPAIV